MSVNKVILVGNVGGDPEVKFMPNGNAVCNLTLATSDSWKDKESGQKQERTEWHRISFFGKIAEIVGQYVKKGSKLYIEGRLQTREWEKDGIKRYTTEIVVDMRGVMQMLDSRQQEDGHSGGQRPQYQAPAKAQQSAPAQEQAPPQDPQDQGVPDMDGFDDDIPF